MAGVEPDTLRNKPKSYFERLPNRVQKLTPEFVQKRIDSYDRQRRSSLAFVLDAMAEVDAFNERERRRAEAQEKALQQAFQDAFETDAQRSDRVRIAREKYQRVVHSENNKIRRQVRRDEERQEVREARRLKIAQDKVGRFATGSSGVSDSPLPLLDKKWHFSLVVRCCCLCCWLISLPLPSLCFLRGGCGGCVVGGRLTCKTDCGVRTNSTRMSARTACVGGRSFTSRSRIRGSDSSVPR